MKRSDKLYGKNSSTNTKLTTQHQDGKPKKENQWRDYNHILGESGLQTKTSLIFPWRVSLMVDKRSTRAHVTKFSVDFRLFVACDRIKYSEINCIFLGLIHHLIWFYYIETFLSIHFKYMYSLGQGSLIRVYPKRVYSHYCSLYQIFFLNVLSISFRSLYLNSNFPKLLHTQKDTVKT